MGRAVGALVASASAAPLNGLVAAIRSPLGVGFDLNVPLETFGHYCAVLQSEMLCLELEPPPSPSPAPAARLHCFLSEDDTSTSSTQHQLAA
ncbi:hypothetical protein OsJ_33655 [Oryza sativa Japonica Group]|uniref:Uncharacterized protein n=1 Tax=Oryza sativa subsp. japonica TaxID=39947 RepID=B9GAC4_ORYSJ|nr:hypothetical protein OsJ_33655 [Oryza sativa Japonica Group]